MELPPLPEMDVYHDQHPSGSGPESFSETRMREYGELCAKTAGEREIERCVKIAEREEAAYWNGEGAEAARSIVGAIRKPCELCDGTGSFVESPFFWVTCPLCGR